MDLLFSISKTAKAKQLYKYSDSKYSTFYPLNGIIELKINSNEFINTYKILKDDPEKYPGILARKKWLSSFFHELMHSHHLMGSPIGHTENFLVELQSKFLKEALQELKPSPDSSLIETRQKILTELSKNHPIRGQLLSPLKVRWSYNGVNTKYLFNRSDSSQYISIGHLLPSIFYYFFAVNDRKFNPSDYAYRDKFNPSGKLERVEKHIIKKSRGKFYHPIDFVLLGDSSDEKIDHDDIHLFRYYSKGQNACFIPPRAVIESYARLSEMYLMSGYGLFQGSNLDKVEKTTENKYFGDYRIINDLLSMYLSFLYGKENRAFFYTCVAIFELSLMVRLHPNTYCLKPYPKIEEFFITLRFAKILKFFVERKISITDLCDDPPLDLIVGLDKICVELGWLKYSRCLKNLRVNHPDPFLYDLFNFTATQKQDFNINNLLPNSKKGFIDHYMPSTLIIFKDDILVYNRGKFSKSYQHIPTYLNTVNSLLSNMFYHEFLFSKNFNETKKIFKNYLVPFCNKRVVKRYLDTHLWGDFISMKDIF